MPENEVRPVSHAFADTEDTRLGRATGVHARNRPGDESGFHPLTSPELATQFATGVDDVIDRVAYRLELETDAYGQERIVWHGTHAGAETTYDVDPDTGFFERFSVMLTGLLPVASQL